VWRNFNKEGWMFDILHQRRFTPKEVDQYALSEAIPHVAMR
jgi:hypothetical protein